MKATGIVRRIDDLGRIVIPKEIRRSFRIREGDPLEIFTDAEGEVIFKKYSPIGELSNFAGQYAEVLHKNGGLPIAIMDNDHVIAASGMSKREVLERRITKNLEELMENRSVHITTRDVPPMNAIEGLQWCIRLFTAAMFREPWLLCRAMKTIYPQKRKLSWCRWRRLFSASKWNEIFTAIISKKDRLS